MHNSASFLRAIAAAVSSAALSLIIVAAPAGAAQPARTISTKQPFMIIVPWAQGGVLDGVARSLAPIIEQSLGNKVVVRNVAGNGTQDGHRAIQNAPTDGYTIGLVSLESATLGATTPGFAVTSSYQPIVQLAGIAPVILLPANSRFRTVGDLIAFARTNPGALKASGSAFGGPWHLALAGLLKANGLTPQAVTWVPSEGAGPALQDLTAGALDFALMPAVLAAPQLQTGNVTMLAVLSAARVPGIAAVPTVAQSGSSAYAFDYWVGFVGPAGMTTAISTQLSVALTKAANDSAFVTALGGAGVFGLNVANSATFGNTLSKSDADLRSLIAGVGSAN